MTLVRVVALIEVDDDMIGDEDPREVASRCMVCIPTTLDRGVVHPVEKYAVVEPEWGP